MQKVLLSPEVQRMIYSQMIKSDEVKAGLADYPERENYPELVIDVHNFTSYENGWRVFPEFSSGGSLLNLAKQEVRLGKEVKLLMLTPLKSGTEVSGHIQYLAITESELGKVGKDCILFDPGIHWK